MARPKIRVQHFLACRGAEVEGLAEPDNPYTLRSVRYRQFVAPDIEFPTTLGDLWVYCRMVNLNDGIGQIGFTVEVVWMDAPRGEELTCFYPELVTYFSPTEPVQSRAWRLPRVQVAGPGG